MIIGISGKIGSGKDEVGNIIHYLNSVHKDSDYNTNNDYSGVNNGWETKKFADKLKDIVCMLIGCTREQLENREFKEKELREEWWMWEYIDYDDIHILTPYLSKKEGNGWNKEVLVKHSPRTLLQRLGTDCGRDIIHPNVWVNSLMADYKQEIDVTHFKSFKGEDSKMIYPNWIITDTRFPNEALAIDDKDGILIRVNRGDGDTGNHPSETALDNFAEWDHIIDNNGTIEDLVERVRRILTKENII